AAIRQAVLAESAEEFNLDHLAGKGLSPSALQDSVTTLPVMASRRLVIVSEFELSGPEAAREKLAKAMIDVVGGLAEQEETVLLVTASKADLRARWVKAFKAPATRVECEAPKRIPELVSFVLEEARSQGLSIEKRAARQLAERIGSQLLALRGELTKVALLAGEGNPISLDHVTAASQDVSERASFVLMDAIGTGRTGAAVSELGSLLASGAAAEQLLGNMASHFRKMARLRAGEKMQGNEWYLNKLESQARRYGQRDLRVCLDRIHEADGALKGIGSLSKEMTLESLVIDLCR
ncbi:MAG: DNA polymerase III subunit delta, partial [Myxococcota bacterium]|nr:DNA polymerase III subunit delta [Myxococcota bacterium]